MTKAHDKHLLKILEKFSQLAINKYTKGVEEHGGKLWKKTGLIDMAIEEAIDQVIYLMTLKQQIDKKTIYTVKDKDKK